MTSEKMTSEEVREMKLNFSEDMKHLIKASDSCDESIFHLSEKALETLGTLKSNGVADDMDVKFFTEKITDMVKRYEGKCAFKRFLHYNMNG